MQTTDFSCIILGMIINFNEISETEIQHMHNGDSFICAKMMMTPESKVMYQRLPAGSSIGRHKMTNGSETNYIISGSGSQICDGVKKFFLKECAFTAQKILLTALQIQEIQI